MPAGTVKQFNLERGFGFIKSDNGRPDIFFHISALEAPQKPPQPGQRVTFEMGVDKRSGKERAINVSVIG